MGVGSRIRMANTKKKKSGPAKKVSDPQHYCQKWVQQTSTAREGWGEGHAVIFQEGREHKKKIMAPPPKKKANVASVPVRLSQRPSATPQKKKMN